MHHFNSIIVISILYLLIGQIGFCQTSQIEIPSSEVMVNLDLPNSQLQVKARLALCKADTIKAFQMLFNSDSKIKSIKSKRKDKWFDMPYEFRGKDTLYLKIPSTLIPSRKITVEFDYIFPLGGFEDSLIFLDRGHRWYPLIPENISRLRLKAIVPPGYIVLSAGDLIEKKTFPEYSQFTWESKIPVFKFPLIIAKLSFYNETVKKCGSKEIYFYSTTVDKEVQEKIISEACTTLKFYNEFIGEYPHNRLTLVEIPEMEGTNIASGFLMIGSVFIEAFKQGYYDNLHLSIAAQWTAAGVFFKLFGKGFWFFQLSLPHYLRLIYLERTKGEDAFIAGLNQGLDTYKEFANTDKDMPIIKVDFLNTKEKGAIIYGKGPYILDKVRNEIGDENWNKLIRDIYKDFKGKIFTYQDFLKYLSKYDRDGACVMKFEKMVSETGLDGD